MLQGFLSLALNLYTITSLVILLASVGHETDLDSKGGKSGSTSWEHGRATWQRA